MLGVVSLGFGRIPLNAQATEATILGTVTDSSGASVPNAIVEAKNTGTDFVRATMSDAEGRYSIGNLPIGDYQVTASLVGFQRTIRTGITLTVGSQLVIDIALRPGQQQETITVEAQTSQVETTSSSVSSLVDQRQITDLPLNGRNIEQLILLAPGVQQITNMQTLSFWGKNDNYSVSGSRGEGQAFLLDDQDMQNFWGRGIGAVALGTSLGVDAIAEFQTLTNTYSAQFGGNGAAINSVSKSGTNQFHGSAFEYLRNSDLDARSFFDGTSVPPFVRNQFGAALGGPVKKNKAFFFVNYEGLKQRLTQNELASVPDLDNRTITATDPAVVAMLQRTLNLLPAPTFSNGVPGFGYALTTGKQVGNENYILARADITISDKDRLFVRLVVDRAGYLDPFSSSNYPYWNETSLTRNYFATIEERRVISPSLVNSARISFSRPESNGYQNNSVPGTQFYPFQGASFNPSVDRQDGTISIPGVSQLGPDIVAPFLLNQKKYGVGDDLFWTKGSHSLTMGLGILYDQTNTFDSFAQGGWWFFLPTGANTGYQNFLAGAPLFVFGPVAQVVAPNQYFNRDTRSTEYTPYIQDEWKLRSNLTVNLGLRYEFQTNPTALHNELHGFNTDPPQYAPEGTPGAFILPGLSVGLPSLPHVWVDGNPSRFNFDPRIGFAYDPFSNHKTSIRAGFGLFHNVLEARTYMPGVWNDAPQLFGEQFFPTYAFNQAFHDFSYANPGSSYTINPGLDHTINTTPYMMQWNMNLQHDFAGNILTVGYVGSKGVHLIMQTDENFPALVAGTDTGPRPNPLAASLALDQARGYSSYHALQIGLRRRLARNLEGQLSYTWSHCIDDGSQSTGLEATNGGGVLPQDSDDIRAEKGNCTFDVRQALRVNALYMLPFHGNRVVEGWQISGILTATAGYPFTVTTGVDTLTGANNPVRPNAIPGCNGEQQILGTLKEWFNPACFSDPEPGVPGDVSRTSLLGPGFTTLDVSLIKDTRMTEAFNIQFRAEFFNALNHPNFGLPDGVLSDPTVGAITTTVGTARQIQFGLRVRF